ncbi:MAG: Rab family GTPase [Promethearchaeia archaeon]
MSSSEDFIFKITLIGDGAVGKTSLIKRYTHGTFEKDYIKTIGAQFSRYNKKIEGDEVELIFWDIAGQDFLFLHPLFYKESKACIIVFSLEENDLGNDSFKHIKDWYKELKKYCGVIPVVLLANKVDLIDESNLNTTKIQNIVDKYNLLDFYTTSAKTGQGVIDAFNNIINKLYLDSKALSG